MAPVISKNIGKLYPKKQVFIKIGKHVKGKNDDQRNNQPDNFLFFNNSFIGALKFTISEFFFYCFIFAGLLQEFILI